MIFITYINHVVFSWKLISPENYRDSKAVIVVANLKTTYDMVIEA